MQISYEAISKSFSGQQTPLDAVAPITLEVASGEFVCLIGPSGCGKSTLLRMTADQLAPTSGRVRLDGQAPGRMRAGKAIAWMAQNPALMPWETVIENVRLPQRVNRRHQRPAPAPRELLQIVGLEEFAGAYPGILSGGMQQRVALARALATGACLWLMDEPFAALDELTRERLTEEVLRLWEQFRPTVLWVTHSVAEAVRLADRIVVMTQRPGSVRAVEPVALPRPRDETSPAAVVLIRRLRSLLRGEILEEELARAS